MVLIHRVTGRMRYGKVRTEDTAGMAVWGSCMAGVGKGEGGKAK